MKTKKTPPARKVPTPVLVVFGFLFLIVVAVAVLEARKDGPGGPAPGAIGGPFTLVDHTGRTVTDRDFRGRYMLIFFGYTFCPDVCPTNLSTVGQALDLLTPELAERIVPVFVSVDPKRDTPEHLARYVANFHPRLVGLTGTEVQIREAAKAYRVYFAKSNDPGDDPDSYLIDHTAITYLMGPDGSFLRHFPHGITPEAMAKALRGELAKT